MISVSYFVLDETMDYPSYPTLLPCIVRFYMLYKSS